MGQEECPLLPIEDLLLFRIDSEKIKKDWNYWKQGYSDSLPLLMSNKRKIRKENLGNIITTRIDWSQLDLEKELRELNKEQRKEKLGLIAIVKENKKSIKRYKNTLKILENKEKQKRRQAEIRRQKEKEQKEMDRWMEEYRR